jgi:hypothetical protein
MAEITTAYEHALLDRAQAGDAEAAREILSLLITRIDQGQWQSPLFAYLAECLVLHVHDGIGIERALGLESETPLGRPPTYEPIELMAIDALLRFHADYGLEAASAWMQEHIRVGRSTAGPDRNTIQSLRRTHRPGLDAARSGRIDRDTLIELTGSLRNKAPGIIPHL